MREKSLDRLFTTMDRLERLTPALTEAEIGTKIEVVRRERKR